MARILSLFLPRFATDRLTRPGAVLAEWRGRPLAVMAREQGGLRVVAVSAAAEGQGVVPGMAAADAFALYPGLKSVAAEPEAEATALEALVLWCRRWSPATAPEGRQGIWLDITGVAHLFGGEAALVADLLALVGRLGLVARAGLADTPGAAWAAARFGEETATIVPEGAARQWLSGFPVAALRLPAAVLDPLRRLGLRRVRDIMGLPRGPLAARFGAEVSLRLDQLLGRLPEPISPLAEVMAPFARLAFAEPIARTADVERGLTLLLADLCRRLEAAGQGARRLEWRLFRVDGSSLERRAGTARAGRDPVHLFRLFREGMDGLDCGFGIEAMTLQVAEVEGFAGVQGELERCRGDETLAPLIDRLERRLGPGRVFRPLPRPSWVPERLTGRAPPLDPPQGNWPVRPRPLRLCARPRSLAVEELDGMPLAFTLGREAFAVARAEGPERIAAEWWHGTTPPAADALRDYWRVEDRRGRRLWLYREGGSGGWRLHGEFG